MKKLVLLLLPLLLLTACNKDKIKAEGAKFFSNATAPVVSEALGCTTGNHTQKFLQQELLDVLKGTKEEQASYESAKQKGVGSLICVTGLGYLRDRIVSWSDSKLSEEMRQDNCSTSTLADQGYEKIREKCSDL